MTKGELISVVRKQVLGGVETSDMSPRFHDRVIEANISMALNTIIYQTFNTNMTELDLFARPYTLEIQRPPNTIPYVQFPAPVIQLKGNRFIRFIGSPSDPSVRFVPVKAGQEATLARLEAGQMHEGTRYEVVYDKIMFHNLDIKAVSVRVDLVVGLSAYEMHEQVYLPSGKEYDISRIVSAMYGVRLPDDLENNNRANA